MPTASASFAPSGVITLTTDFGHSDPFVGVMKGQLLRRHPAVRVVDLTHGISVHRPREAGFWLARSYGWFPAGTVHVAVVDPGVGSARGLAAVEADGHVFLAPDNGLLAAVVARVPAARLRLIDAACLRRHGLDRPSATFHGRDIFAPLAAELAAGRLVPTALGPAVPRLVGDPGAEPRREGDDWHGAVVTVDHFGNLQTNLDASLMQGLVRPVIRVAGRELALQRTYADVAVGDYLAVVNSFGVLEVARAGGSAAEGLALGPGADVVLGSLETT